MVSRGNTLARCLLFFLVGAFLSILLAGCGGQGQSEVEVVEPAVATPVPPTPAAPVPVPPSALSEMALEGEELFNANCSACHGAGAVGTNLGPPLMHRVYHPGHHPDFSIRNAVSQGVIQHHWPFGDMAPVAGVESPDVEQIICYIRERQRAEGIFEGDDFGTVC